MSWAEVGVDHSFTALILSCWGVVPSSDNTWPRKGSVVRHRLALLFFRIRPSLRRISKTIRRCFLCSSMLELATRMSSTKHRTKSKPENSRSTCICQMLGLFFMPMGNTHHSKEPSGVDMAVFSMSSLAIGICQNPHSASTVEKTRAPRSEYHHWHGWEGPTGTDYLGVQCPEINHQSILVGLVRFWH